MKNTFKAQTVKCVDRGLWVRELTDQNGDCVAELSVESTQSALANKNEALFIAAPEMLEALESVFKEMDLTTKSQFKCFDKVRAAIAKAKGET